MTELNRLLDDDATAFERALLSSASADRGSPVARERAVRAAAAAALITAESVGVAAAPSTLAVSGLAKWAATGVLLGSVVASTTRLLQPSPELPRESATPPSTAATTPVAPPQPAKRIAAASGVAPDPAPAVTALPDPDRANRVSRAAQAAAPSSAPESSLAAELATLRETRAALAAGEGNQALRSLDRYDSAFAHPALQPEATLLRIEALLATGAPGPAKALADHFLAEHPSGAHADRARQLRERAAMH
jgi:hypothetical protein